jgi:hypothetical protein
MDTIKEVEELTNGKLPKPVEDMGMKKLSKGARVLIPVALVL